MKEWIKPELYVENFELDQHVAAGCTTKTKITVTPGGSITVTLGCASKYGTPDSGGHWRSKETITDTDGNGIIDWAEVTTAIGTATNGVVTGKGHGNHTHSIYLPDGEEIEIINQPFTS